MNIILYLIILVVLISAGLAGAAPWVPTKKKDVGRMVKAAAIKPGEKSYDLGCGDGRLVFKAAEAGAESSGVEMFILIYLYAKIKSFFIPHTHIYFGDFFHHDLSEANVVFIFLMPKAYKKLIDKLEKELKPGGRVVTYCWPIQEWAGKLIFTDKPDDAKLPIYTYKIN